ncbi:MAG TPA: chemotaxis protein CheA [Thermoanaerobacter sp.]|nr:MAG: CheA signal transduction histidine kinase [Thermoanaerobacter thermocopriae]HAA63661.1 chemotaxis protein CheA [Thermoanaerobacter sp.]
MENNQYIDIFIEESQEHIENLNSNLLLLENDPKNRQIIDEIFRSAHTLKGMAATMGFENMNKLAHKMEDVLQEVKNIEKRLLSIAEVNKVEVELINIDLNKEGETFVKEASFSQSQSFENIKKSQSNNKTSKSVRVDIDRLDNLMNLVSELIIIKTRLEGLEADNRNSETASAIEYLERITTNLHDAVMKVRMVPVERVFNRFPRMVRDLSYELGKKIILNMYGQDTEVDRTVIDEIGDPLIHLIRNSIDHGIEMPQERLQKGKPEQGTINLRAYHEGNNVIIEVSDDGRGIDIEKVKAKAVEKGIYTAEQVNDLSKDKILDLLFRPGFSTTDKVTDISGRGVGLDVVKNKIESLNGSIEILSEINKGTKFIIKLPLTLAIIQALLVKVGDEKFAIPLNSISEIVHKKEEEIHNVQGKEVVLFRGKVIPIIRLNEVLETKKISNNGNLVCVIIKKGENLACCTVDELIGQQEIVIKPLGKYLSNVKVIAGATILGDGQVALIVDANNLF